MAFTEIQKRNNKKYFYRVISIRKGKKVVKKREYLGVDLSKDELNKKIMQADKKLPQKKIIKKNMIEELKPIIIKILKKNKIKKAGIFGSYVRGEQKKNSDIDIIIEPTKGMGLDFVGVKFQLENKLKRKVDLVTYKGIHPYLKKRISNEEVRII